MNVEITDVTRRFGRAEASSGGLRLLGRDPGRLAAAGY
jgi:hypothetical protein